MVPCGEMDGAMNLWRVGGERAIPPQRTFNSLYSLSSSTNFLIFIWVLQTPIFRSLLYFCVSLSSFLADKNYWLGRAQERTNIS